MTLSRKGEKMYLAKPEISNRQWSRTEQNLIKISFGSRLNLAIKTVTIQYKSILSSICHLTRDIRHFIALDNTVTERSTSRGTGKLKVLKSGRHSSFPNEIYKQIGRLTRPT